MDKNEIKNNIIQNFLNPGYKYASVHIKKTIIANIIKQSWFPVEYGECTDTLYFFLGNDVVIPVDIVWQKSNNEDVWRAIKFI